MEVVVAKTAGFCWGVKRAMDIVLEAADKETETIYTYGPLIHNPQVIGMLESKNVKVLKDLEAKDSKNIVIRTHGISPDERKKIKEKGFTINDATCPLVARVQGLIRKNARRGYHTVIVGDSAHAEVIGLMGFTEGKGRVIKSMAEVDTLPTMEKVCVVGQTTLNKTLYKEVSEKLLKRYDDCIVEDTVCDATDERQDGIKQLVKEVEAVVVVGGKNSANTAHLAQISGDLGLPTFHVETEEELDGKELARFRRIGVSAGASTPNWMIKRVVEHIEKIGEREEGLWARSFYRAMEFLAWSNLYIAVGASFMTYAASILSGTPWTPLFSLISFLYFFSMYNLNSLTDWEAAKFNDPPRMAFYEKQGATLLSLSIVSILGALIIAATLGWLPTLVLVTATGLGVAYCVKPGPIKKLPRLKDIPASKDLFVAFAWAVVCTLFPAVADELPGITLSHVVVFLFVFTLVYIRSVLFDIRDIHGDRRVGRETIPIIIGKEWTKGFLLAVTFFVGGALLLVSYLGFMPTTGYLMLPPLFYTAFYLFLYHRRIISQGISCEWVVDGTFIFTGLVVSLWTLILQGN